jgi:hypothetical protein
MLERPKGSLTIDEFKRLFDEGHTIFYISSSHFKSFKEICLKNIILDEKNTITKHWFEYIDMNPSIYFKNNSITGKASSHDHNLIRLNCYNDWFVFENKNDALCFRSFGDEYYFNLTRNRFND